MLLVPTYAEARQEYISSASVTTSGTSSVKGSPAQLVAATARDCHLLEVFANGIGTAATVTDCCLDILLGAATEDVLIANLLAGGSGATHWLFPVFIPEGTRIAAQAASSRLSTAMNVACRLYHFPGGPPFKIGSIVTTYGITTVPDGTTVAPGASGAEGTYTEIVASTTADHFAFVPSFQVNSDTTQNARRLRIDIGAGAATEDTIATDQTMYTQSDERTFAFWWPAYKNVPSGTRLAMRASNSGTNDAGYTGAIHAVS